MLLSWPGLLCSTEDTKDCSFLWGERSWVSWEPQVGSFWHKLSDPESKG